MEDSFSSKALPTAREAANTVRETLLKVCRHYQDSGLGPTYITVAHYYEKQVAAIPPPPEKTVPAKLHS